MNVVYPSPILLGEYQNLNDEKKKLLQAMLKLRHQKKKKKPYSKPNLIIIDFEFLFCYSGINYFYNDRYWLV